jgi:Arm DNA-binding domain
MPALTDTRIRALKPRPTIYRVADMGGLCLEVRPTGAKTWRFRYRFAGKANMPKIGPYPQVSLQDARKERDQQRHIPASGGDPSSVRRTAAVEASVGAANSFEAVAREWMAKQKKWKASTRAKAKWLLETYAFPWIGTRPISEITPMDMLTHLRRPEALGKIETAHRLKQPPR